MTRKTPVPLPSEESVPEAEGEAEAGQAETEPALDEKELLQQPSPSLRSRLSARFSAQPSASRTSRHKQSRQARPFCLCRALLPGANRQCLFRVCIDREVTGRAYVCQVLHSNDEQNCLV